MTSSGLGRRFWTLWSAFTATNLGDGFSIVAFPLLAEFTLDADALEVALVFVFRVLPFVVLGLPAGVILDRYDRRVLSIIAQLVRAGVMAVTVGLVATDLATIPLMVAMAFIIGGGEVIADAGLPAMVQRVVATDRLEVANSRLSGTQAVTNYFVGPPLGSLLFALHPAGPFAAAAGLFGVAIVVLFRLPGSFHPADGTSGEVAIDPTGVESEQGPLVRFRSELTVGLRYVWGHPVLRPLALSVALFSFVGEAGNAVFIKLAVDRFGLDAFQYGLLLGLDGVVSVAMSFLVAGLVGRTSHSTSMRFSVVCYVTASLLFGSTTALAGAVVASVFNGLADPPWNVVSGTVRQRLVPTEIFGRMMTAYLAIAWSMQPVGAFLGGLIARQWGPQWVYLISGSAVASLLVLARPMFRAVDEAMAMASDGVPDAT